MHAHPAQGALPCHFSRSCKIRFSDCDPAGIVFFPQYFVMFNGLIEDWFDDGLQLGYRQTILGERIGLPTVHIEADFKAVSRMGDEVSLSLTVLRLGERSLTLQLRCTGADAGLRMQSTHVLVTTSLDDHCAIRIPEKVRAAIMMAGGLQ